MGDESGLVVNVDRLTGRPVSSVRLPQGVKCIVGDGDYLYVGTNGGEIYDVSEGRPRLVAMIEGFGELYWIDIHGGRVAAADNSGNVGLLDCEGEVIWKNNVGGSRQGWMCRMDESGVYYGGNTGVRKFDLDGNEIWSAVEHIDVAFGMQTSDHVWAIGLVSESHSPLKGLIGKICKKSGKVEALIQIDALDSLSISPDGSRVYDANLNCQPVVNPRDTTGQLPHHVPWSGASWTDVKLPFDLMSQIVYGDCIYGVGGCHGKARFLCIDLSDGAIEGALANSASGGKVRRIRTREWTQRDRAREETVDDGSIMEVTSTADGKVIIDCIRVGGRVRARVASSGYDSNLNCQFPTALRQEGSRYVVDAVELAPSGDFYRCRGTPLRYAAESG